MQRAPLTIDGEVRERCSRTEALRHGGAQGWMPDRTMDGPYARNHAALGVDITVWRVPEDSGEGQLGGVPGDIDEDAANSMARASDGARLTAVHRERNWEGLDT